MTNERRGLHRLDSFIAISLPLGLAAQRRNVSLAAQGHDAHLVGAVDRQDHLGRAAALVERVPALEGRTVSVLIWTTTPWTLPSNLAIMVGEDIDYVVVESSLPTGSPERYVIAEARVAAYARELGEEAAQAIQLAIQYDPEPPFDSGTPEKAPQEIVEAVTQVAASGDEWLGARR